MWPRDAKADRAEPGVSTAPSAAPPTGRKVPAVEDTRRLAVRRCILTCLTNGWAPPAESVWRLVALREAWVRGERREDTIDQEAVARLAFARWLYQHGRLGG